MASFDFAARPLKRARQLTDDDNQTARRSTNGWSNSREFTDDSGVLFVIAHLKVGQILFSHDTASSRFRRKHQFANWYPEIPDFIFALRLNPDPELFIYDERYDRIRVIQWPNGSFYALDHRRLYCYKQALQPNRRIQVWLHRYQSSSPLDFKFSSLTDGVSLSRGYAKRRPGDSHKRAIAVPAGAARSLCQRKLSEWEQSLKRSPHQKYPSLYLGEDYRGDPVIIVRSRSDNGAHNFAKQILTKLRDFSSKTETN